MLVILAGAPLRADGITLSTDGLTWSKGVGGYGNAWGDAGTGITVRKGETIYIKYYREGRDSQSLYYADHGRGAGGWKTIGPVLSGDVGDGPSNPVILRISKVGTPGSTVAWMNGRGKSGIWSALPAPGPYDLAVHENSRWTLPPITITEQPPSIWRNFMGWLKSDAPASSAAIPSSVPDGGNTAALLSLALLSLAVFLVRKLHSPSRR